MELLKKYLGLLWIILGIYVAYAALSYGYPLTASDKLEDRVFGWVMLCVLTPILVGGLILFGKYALDGEYKANE